MAEIFSIEMEITGAINKLPTSEKRHPSQHVKNLDAPKLSIVGAGKPLLS